MSFLANLHTHEFHDLSVTNNNCQIGEIHKSKPYGSVQAALNAGFDPCDYCLPQVLTAKHTYTPRPVVRADTITLDGRKSKPRHGAFKVTEYLWTITPAGDAGNEITSTEPTLTFTILDDITATLQVKNAAGDTQQRELTITCTPRQWKIIKWQSPATGGALQQGLVNGSVSLGRNIRALEAAAQTSGHVIHRDAPNATWKDTGYTTSTLTDNGPFTGCSYLTAHTLLIQRDELRSRDLFTDSDLWATNTTAAHSQDIASVAASVIDHEHFHTKALYRIWQKGGTPPVKALEALVNDDANQLVTDADDIIIAFETDLQADNYQESTVHTMMATKWGGKTATILIHDGPDYTTYTIPDLAQAGD